MTESKNDGARNRIALLASAAVLSVFLSGCSADEELSPTLYAHELPSVTEYASEAVEMRGEAASDTEISGKNVKETSAVTTVTKDETSNASSKPVTTTVTTTRVTTSAPETTSVSQTAHTSEPVFTEPVTAQTSAPAETKAETTQAVTTAAPVQTTTAAATMPLAPTDYDSDFFSEDLFIGDSISTGYSLYGFLNDRNVYAKVGLNPSTVLTKNVSTIFGEIGVSDMLAYTTPKRVYIMLGSNGIQWLSVGNMLQSTNTLIGIIRDTVPDAQPVIISVPPVTTGYDSTVPDVDVMAKINEYNNSLSAYCTANKFLFVDAASILKDESGYFNLTYAESDGMHFKSSAYKTLLSKIQTDVMLFEEANAPKIETQPSETAPDETEAVSESVTEASTAQTLPATFVTLPESAEKTNAKNKLSD